MKVCAVHGLGASNGIAMLSIHFVPPSQEQSRHSLHNCLDQELHEHVAGITVTITVSPLVRNSSADRLNAASLLDVAANKSLASFNSDSLVVFNE